MQIIDTNLRSLFIDAIIFQYQYSIDNYDIRGAQVEALEGPRAGQAPDADSSGDQPAATKPRLTALRPPSPPPPYFLRPLSDQDLPHIYPPRTPPISRTNTPEPRAPVEQGTGEGKGIAEPGGSTAPLVVGQEPSSGGIAPLVVGDPPRQGHPRSPATSYNRYVLLQAREALNTQYKEFPKAKENDRFFYSHYETRKSTQLALDALLGASGAAGPPRRRRLLWRPNQTTLGRPPITRNSARGLRSEAARQRRQEQRSMKRNLARNLHRRQNHLPTAPAQELQPRPPRLQFGLPYIISSLNVRGMKKRGKRQEIERYMEEQQIDIMLIQETHIGDEIIENFKKSNYVWYYSGGGLAAKGETCYHGVGIIIRKELKNYILDVETISERLMTITLRGRIPVTLASAYAPTAAATAEDKDNFYEAFRKITHKHKKKGILYVGADLNARLIDPGDYDDGIGPHIFGAGLAVDREELAGVEDNRARLQEHLIVTRSTLANTLFPKQPQGLITYKLDKTIGTTPPYDNKRYATLDYFLTHKKWRNNIRNVHSDMQAGIDTDHFPLLMTVRIKLKAEYGKRITRTKYVQCTDNQREAFNDHLQSNLTTTPTHHQLISVLRASADAHIPKKLPNPSRPFEFSDDSEELLRQKKQQIREGANDTGLKEIRSKISKSIRKDRRKHEAEMIGPELDIRDQFMGLRRLRKPYVPVPLSIKDSQGKHVPLHRRAQFAAEFLGKEIWGEAHPTPQELVHQIASDSLVTDDLRMNTGEITLSELEGAIRKLQRGKAAGPDGLPIDIFKELNPNGQNMILHLLNTWWNGEQLSPEITQAHVVLIFKKGNKADLGNYRPISLLNSVYKIYTTILQQRLAKVLDKHLQKTQYGFRKRKSTANAVHYVRRVMEKGEKQYQNTVYIVRLGKGF